MSISHDVVQELQYLPDAHQQEVLRLVRSLRREAVTGAPVAKRIADEEDETLNPQHLYAEAVLGHS